MIIYFSGTGNSLQLAQDLAHLTSDTAISFAQSKTVDLSQASCIGLIYPVYNHDIPPFVQTFIDELAFNTQAYVYGVVCHGGDIGNAIYRLQELVTKKGAKLAYVNDVKMPVNSRIMYYGVTDQIEERIAASKLKLTSIAADILAQKKNLGKVKEKRFFTFTRNMVTKPFVRQRLTPRVDPTACIGCRICEQVCPVGNISLMDKKAYVDTSCEQCMTCMHWCPETAIHFPKRNVKPKQQYHHPEVTWQDIRKNKN